MYLFVALNIYSFIQDKLNLFGLLSLVLAVLIACMRKISPSDAKWWLWTTNCLLTWLACKSENIIFVIKYCILQKVVDRAAVRLRKAHLYSSHIALESILVWNGNGWGCFCWGSTIAMGVSIGNAFWVDIGVHWLNAKDHSSVQLEGIIFK